MKKIISPDETFATVTDFPWYYYHFEVSVLLICPVLRNELRIIILRNELRIIILRNELRIIIPRKELGIIIPRKELGIIKGSQNIAKFAKNAKIARVLMGIGWFANMGMGWP
jgi:hypothetical protein